MPVRRSLGPDPTSADSTASAVRTLRDLGMPLDEIDAILQTDDRLLVHRYLELHRERLEEWLAEQWAVLVSIEPVLAAGPAAPGLDPCALGRRSRFRVSRRCVTRLAAPPEAAYTIGGIYLALGLMWFAIDMLDDSSGYWFYWPMLGTGLGVVVTGVVLGGVGGLFGHDWRVARSNGSWLDRASVPRAHDPVELKEEP